MAWFPCRIFLDIEYAFSFWISYQELTSSSKSCHWCCSSSSILDELHDDNTLQLHTRRQFKLNAFARIHVKMFSIFTHSMHCSNITCSNLIRRIHCFGHLYKLYYSQRGAFFAFFYYNDIGIDYLTFLSRTKFHFR